MTVLEAWSWGLPVLMTSECNLPEGARANAAIMMTPDVDSIANALRQLFSMTDPERAAMGMNGRNLVGEQFQWSKAANQMADVYDWALGIGSKPGCVLN
jgi:poly(glycerol-phosphate) alpha-glucosyltransferase